MGPIPKKSFVEPMGDTDTSSQHQFLDVTKVLQHLKIVAGYWYLPIWAPQNIFLKLASYCLMFELPKKCNESWALDSGSFQNPRNNLRPAMLSKNCNAKISTLITLVLLIERANVFFPLTRHYITSSSSSFWCTKADNSLSFHFMKDLFRECVRDFGKPIPIIFEGS